MDQRSPPDSEAAYELVEEHGFFKLVRARASGRSYVSWYDAEARRTRRMSVQTNKASDAHEEMRFLADLGITGDPRTFLNKKQVRTVAEADTAFNSAVHRSKIGKKVNTHSIRHSLSRYMRKMRVDLEEIGIFLGHGNHDPETTAPGGAACTLRANPHRSPCSLPNAPAAQHAPFRQPGRGIA